MAKADPRHLPVLYCRHRHTWVEPLTLYSFSIHIIFDKATRWEGKVNRASHSPKFLGEISLDMSLQISCSATSFNSFITYGTYYFWFIYSIIAFLSFYLRKWPNIAVCDVIANKFEIVRHFGKGRNSYRFFGFAPVCIVPTSFGPRLSGAPLHPY